MRFRIDAVATVFAGRVREAFLIDIQSIPPFAKRDQGAFALTPKHRVLHHGPAGFAISALGRLPEPITASARSSKLASFENKPDVATAVQAG